MRELETATPLRRVGQAPWLENLVAVQPRRGTFVAAWRPPTREHPEVRAELEGYAAELAAARLDPMPARRRACCTSR